MVNLTEERIHLLDFGKSGIESARKLNRTRILLLADDGKTDPEVVNVLHTSSAAV